MLICYPPVAKASQVSSVGTDKEKYANLLIPEALLSPPVTPLTPLDLTSASQEIENDILFMCEIPIGGRSRLMTKESKISIAYEEEIETNKTLMNQQGEQGATTESEVYERGKGGDETTTKPESEVSNDDIVNSKQSVDRRPK